MSAAPHSEEIGLHDDACSICPPVEWWPLRKVLTEYRPGSHDDDWTWEQERADLMERDRSAMQALMGSIHRHGQQRPINIGDDGRVWDGHHRVVACMEMGGVWIQVVDQARLSGGQEADRG